MTAIAPERAARARASLGGSDEAIYRMVARAVAARHPGGGALVDVGCGAGRLWPWVAGRFDRYLGIDAVRYPGFPDQGELHLADLDDAAPAVPEGSAAVAAAVETIEHLENPRALVRLLTRLVRPGGWVLVTTPNQHSWLSKGSFLLRGEHAHFRGAAYPAHITPLLEIDLRRIAAECGLVEVAIEYSGRGRIPGSGRHWPAALSRRLGRACSDNLLLAGRRPGG